jgi:rSAM/selenodomain-associated transferase 1
MKYPQARVLLMSKAPVPGKVKTRLIPLLGADAAASFYQQLLEDTLDDLCAAALCPVELWCAPDVHHAFFTKCRDRYLLELAGQSTGDLGQRMSHAVKHALQCADQVVVIGGDCPTLNPDDIDTALCALADGTDVVLGPAADGGYYLVGMHTHHPRLFESIAWGSAAVLEQTEQRLAALGLSYRKLATRHDIDTPEDYLVWQTSRLP